MCRGVSQLRESIIRVCATDQNRACSANSGSIAQLPNTGGDSAQFSSKALIDRFYENYNKTPQSQHKLFTLLTHPETWYREKNNITPALDEIAKHNYATDSGPVLYTTLYGAYQTWQQNKLLPDI